MRIKTHNDNVSYPSNSVTERCESVWLVQQTKAKLLCNINITVYTLEMCVEANIIGILTRNT